MATKSRGRGNRSGEKTSQKSGKKKLPAKRSRRTKAAKSTPDMTWLNRRLKDLLMHAPSAIGITAGPEHTWAYVNLARVAMAGRTKIEDFVGKTVRQSYPELKGQPFFNALDQAYTTGVAFVGKELKGTFNRGDGGGPDEAYLDCVYQPIRDDDGKVEGLLIHTVEVTEQVLARREMERASEREKQQRAIVEFERNQLQELFQQAPAGIAILSGPEHIWTFANPGYCEVVGRACGELLNRTIRETLPELEGQGFFELLDHVYRTGVPFIGKDVKAMLNRGPEREPEETYFDFVYQPVRNILGETIALMALAVDVTEQFRARTQLETVVQERTYELQQAHRTLQNLSGRLLQAQDEERRRVARDLHDSVGQYLAAMQMNLSTINGSGRLPDELKSCAADTADLLSRCSAEIRTISYLLHPPLLDEMGLASAVSWYVDGFAERSGITVKADVPADLPRFSPDVETAMFRVIQQGLANVHRHSQSKTANIRLARDGDSLALELSDDGQGMPPEMLEKFRQSSQLPGVGISGMRQRIQSLAGSFDIRSSGAGTTIAVKLPAQEVR